MSMLSSYTFTTDMISQDTKENLSKNCSRRGSNFDSSIIRSSQCTRCGINVTDHEISEIDSEEIVGVSVTKTRSEKFAPRNIQSDTSNYDGSVRVSVIK